MINRGALSRVDCQPQRVELLYQYSDDREDFMRELERLVLKEQSCCGAAGVSFDVKHTAAGSMVIVCVVSAGLPAQTVIAAFAEMTPA